MSSFAKPQSFIQTKVQTVQSFVDHFERQQEPSFFEKTYTKLELTNIFKELNEADPLYYCEKQQLEMIYDKVIKQERDFKGTTLTDLANELKERNRLKFQQQIETYKKYITQAKTKNKQSIKSKDLLNYLYDLDQMGFLTDRVYDHLKQTEQISVKKLSELINEIEQDFLQKQKVSVPKKISLKKSQRVQQQQENFEQILFEVVQRDNIDVQFLRNLKDQILRNLQDPLVSRSVQKQMNHLEDMVKEINERTIPDLREQVINLTAGKRRFDSEMFKIYQELDQKSNQVVQARNAILQLTQQTKTLSKQIMSLKLSQNQKQQINCELILYCKDLQTQLSNKNQQTNNFMNQYTQLKAQYENFIAKIKQQQEQKQLKTNIFPPLSLKQQLQDAQVKINKLRRQKQVLMKDMQMAEQVHFEKIQQLEKQLQEAKRQADRTQQLKMTGMSQLSKFQVQNSRFVKQSMFGSVVSALRQSKRVKEHNKISMFLEETDEIMRMQRSKLKNSHKSMKNTKKQPQFPQQITQLENKLQQSLCRQYKQDQQKYNFCQISYGQLRKRWSQHPDTLDEDSLSPQKTDPQQSMKDECHSQHTMFICPTEIVSKSGVKYKKHIQFNRKGIYLFDTKYRLEKQMRYEKVSKIIFGYYNVDCFVISFKLKQSPMKKKVINTESDIIFKCAKTKQLITFLSQPIFKDKILIESKIRVKIQKQQDIWIRDNNDKKVILSNCGNFYNPFRLNLSLKNDQNFMFYAQLSRQAIFSRSYIVICIVEEFGVYCFEWNQDDIESQRTFIYLLPLVYRMSFIREPETNIVKVIYEDWSDGKTFLLRFKNSRESLKFQIVCKERLKANLAILNARKKLIQNTFPIDQSLNFTVTVSQRTLNIN